MADEENDPERRARVNAIAFALQEASVGKPIRDTQTAVANAVARMAFSSEDPEAVVLTTIEAISEVYRAFARHKRQGTPVDEVLN